MSKITPHSNAWYDQLSLQQEGYFYPWQSTLGAGDGETAFFDLVRDNVSENARVLDAGCGHGDVTLGLAPLCQSIIGYDRVQSYIEIAERNRQTRDIPNASFVCHDSHKAANNGHVALPARDNSIDLVISRRGPTHWIEDAKRICKPNAILIQLNPLGRIEEPDWNPALPESLRLSSLQFGDADWVIEKTEDRLTSVGLKIDESWTYDVPEWLHAPVDLYRCLTFGDDPKSTPRWEEVESKLNNVFERFAGPRGLEDRQRRYLWKAKI